MKNNYKIGQTLFVLMGPSLETLTVVKVIEKVTIHAISGTKTTFKVLRVDNGETSMLDEISIEAFESTKNMKKILSKRAIDNISSMIDAFEKNWGPKIDSLKESSEKKSINDEKPQKSIVNLKPNLPQLTPKPNTVVVQQDDGTVVTVKLPVELMELNT